MFILNIDTEWLVFVWLSYQTVLDVATHFFEIVRAYHSLGLYVELNKIG